MTIANSRLTVAVALLPDLAGPVDSQTCVVIDVLRAATSLTFMAQTGVKEVTIVPDPPAARKLRGWGLVDDVDACGEVDRVPVVMRVDQKNGLLIARPIIARA